MAHYEEPSTEATINRLVSALLDQIQKTEEARLALRVAEARESSVRSSGIAKRRMALLAFEDAAERMEGWQQRFPASGWSDDQQLAFNEAAGLIRGLVKQEREKLEAEE